MEYVQLAETPGGERFSVVVAPPGSALDAGGQFPAGGALGSMIAVVRMIFRSSRRGWRVAVTPCDIHGRATGAAHRERVADEEAATTRAQAIVGAIRTGQFSGRVLPEHDHRRRSGRPWRRDELVVGGQRQRTAAPTCRSKSEPSRRRPVRGSGCRGPNEDATLARAVSSTHPADVEGRPPWSRR
jgi:hypothetical protein